MIPHSKPSIGEKEIETVASVIRSGMIAQGEKVARFEEELAYSLGGGFAAACSSGTAGLFLALKSIGIGRGDEVALPDFVCSAPLQAIIACGAVPRLVDIEPSGFNLDPVDLKRRITSKTKAIILPHIFGLPASVDEILSLGIPVIEDCAMSIGASYQGKPVGSLGVASVFSFYATKVITTGEGGMVFSHSRRIIEKIKGLREYDEKEDFRPRFNFKMSDIEAAIGLVQLQKLHKLIEKRRLIAKKYIEGLKKLPLVLPEALPGREHIFFRFVVLKKGKEADKLISRLKEQGIEARKPIFRPLSLYIGMSGFPRTEEAFREAVSLPIYPGLRDREVKRVLFGVKEAVEQ
jgi:perosamine synthetase